MTRTNAKPRTARRLYATASPTRRWTPAQRAPWRLLCKKAINEGARQSWKLISVAQDPKGEGLLLIWDTSGFFSG